ncbi:MAG: hypothetical protein Kow0020_06280 [Wenzhouxiangellaceae bacterium]
MQIIKPWLLLMAALGLSGSALAQQSMQAGPYEIHYNAFTSDRLAPEVASAYGIRRAGNQAILNITVLKRDSKEPVRAWLSAAATNLTGQRREIEMREISDQGAIYYLGQFRINDEETLDFEVLVVPEGHAGPPYEVSFRQQFFTP